MFIKLKCKPAKLSQLEAFTDKDGALKVRGRPCESTLANAFKHPTIVTKNHHTTKLILGHFHEKVGHQGKDIWNTVKWIWIPGIIRAVASYIRQCVKCGKLRRATEQQRMADLPPERVESSPPLTYCAMGCLGTFLWNKKGRSGNDTGLSSPVLLKGSTYWHAEWSVCRFLHKWSTLSFIITNAPVKVMLAEYGKDKKSQKSSQLHTSSVFRQVRWCFSKKLPLMKQ